MMKTRPWNVNIESFSNFKFKLSLIKSPPINAAYQLYLHLCNNNGLYMVPLKWNVWEDGPSWTKLVKCGNFLHFDMEIMLFLPVTHHWVGRILPLQSWFSSQLPCPYPEEKSYRLQVQIQKHERMQVWVQVRAFDTQRTEPLWCPPHGSQKAQSQRPV